MYAERVLSGMRPTGRLHLGHYHGVLKNWVDLQAEYPCLFFVADWHALTTNYDSPLVIEESVWDMVIDWLAAGVDPTQATIFIQSRVPEHAELHLLLSMMCPLGWLERVPTYKDQQEKLTDKDLSTYGFLGYPLLQSADILIYRADKVPVGEDQVPHVELTREVARRFNHLYGREPGFEDKALEAIKKLGRKRAKLYEELRTYKDNFLLSAQKPLFRDILLLYDAVSRAQRRFADGEEQVSRDEAVKALQDIIDEILEVLYRRDIERIDEQPDRLDIDFQKPVRRIETDDPNEDKTVESVVRDGFRMDGALLRPQEVVVKRCLKEKGQ